MTQPTSLEMYAKIQESGLLSRMRLLVYSILIQSPQGMTANEMRYVARIQYNMHNAEHLQKRLSELEKMGCIQTLKTRKCRQTGNKSIVWAINYKMPIKLARETKEQKKLKALEYLESLDFLDEMNNNIYCHIKTLIEAI